MRLIVPYAKIHARSHASRERKRSCDRRYSFHAVHASRLVSWPTISQPRLASLRGDIAPHHREPVQRNDFNEAASITSVNRARALTGDLRPVGRARAYTSIQRGGTSSRSARSHRQGTPDLDHSFRGFRRLSGRLSGNDTV